MEFFNPKKMNVPFVKTFKYFVTFSSIIFVVCLFLIFVKPGIKYGVDFRGGVEAGVAFKDPTMDSAKLRAELNPVIPDVSIVEVQGGSKQGFAKEFLITGVTDKKENAAKLVEEHLQKYGQKDQDWAVTKMDNVGPRVGNELKKSALMSLLYTAILITLYIYIRFDMRYSPGAMLAVFHDLVFTCGFLVLTGTEFSTTVVAALLTLAGYSINDTVVVFDRIREVEATMFGKSKEYIVNYAINSTLSRTTNTGLAMLISLAVLWLVGGASLRDFSTTLFFGVLVGMYSSIYIASPLYIWSDEYLNRKTVTPPPSGPVSKSGKMKEAKV